MRKALRDIFSSLRGNPCTLLLPGSGARPATENRSSYGRICFVSNMTIFALRPLCSVWQVLHSLLLRACRGIPCDSGCPLSHPCGSPRTARSALPCGTGRGIPCILPRVWRAPGSLRPASARDSPAPYSETGEGQGTSRKIRQRSMRRKSVHEIGGDDMDDAADPQQPDKRGMQDMPQTEQSLVG